MMPRLGLFQVGMGECLMSPLAIELVLMVVNVKVNFEQLRG